MHQDLAKISWNFVAKSVISGKLYMSTLQGPLMNDEHNEIVELESPKEVKEDRSDGSEKERLKPKKNKEESKGARTGNKMTCSTE